MALFNPPDTTSGIATGAASSITVALTSGSQIAAAANGGASGDNSNLTNMIDLQNQSIINGSTPTDAFSNLTFSIGNTISHANSDATATGNILTQLQNQQGSVEGVSLDEEIVQSSALRALLPGCRESHLNRRYAYGKYARYGRHGSGSTKS